MLVTLPSLKSTLLQNVVEIKFFRRRPIPYRPAWRRMLCTNCYELLNSFNGKMVLNYRNAIYRPHFNAEKENLIISWDCMMQDYRCINMDECDLIRTIPADESFWKYFNEWLLPMSPAEKMTFMDI